MSSLEDASAGYYSVGDINQQFLVLLDQELKHVQEFFNEQVEILKQHVQHLQKELRELFDEEHPNTRRSNLLQSESFNTKASIDSKASLSYENFPSFTADGNQTHKSRLCRVIIGIWDFCNRLEDFVQLNGVALYKILKKRDKILSLRHLAQDLQAKRKMLSQLTLSSSLRDSLIESFQMCNEQYNVCIRTGTHEIASDAPVIQYINEMEFLIQQHYALRPVTSGWIFFFWGCSLIIIIDVIMVAFFFTPVDPDFFREIVLEFFPIFRFTLMICLLVWGTAIVTMVFEFYGVNYKFLLNMTPKEQISSTSFLCLASFLTSSWIFILALLIFDLQFGIFFSKSTIWIYPFLLCVTYILIFFFPSHSITFTTRRRLIAQIGKTLKSGFVPSGRVTLTNNIIGDILTSTTKPILDGIYTCLFFSSLLLEPKTVNSILTLRHFSYVILCITFLPYWIRFVQCFKRFLQEDQLSYIHIYNMGKYLSTILVIVTSYIDCLELRHEQSIVYKSILYLMEKMGLSIYASRLLFVLVYLFASLYNLIWDCTVDWGLLPDPDHFIRSAHRMLYPQWLYYFITIVNLFGRLLWALTLVPIDIISDERVNREVILLMISSLEIARRTAFFSTSANLFMYPPLFSYFQFFFNFFPDSVGRSKTRK